MGRVKNSEKQSAEKQSKRRPVCRFSLQSLQAFLVGIVLIYAIFPPLNRALLAWVAWVPMLYAATRLRGWRLVGGAWVSGYLL